MINLNRKYKYVLVCLLLLAFVYVAGATFYTQTLTYTKTVNMAPGEHKSWGYIEPAEYGITLNDGDSINIAMDITSDKPIDVTEFRFYNMCNIGSFPKLGKFYTKVDNLPVLPTIGFDTSNYPVWVGLPECDKYGSTQEFIFDTNDTKGTGLHNYNFVYHGYSMKIKSLEYYIVTYN